MCFWDDREEEHHCNGADKGKEEQQPLATIAMVCRTAYRDDYECLEQHTQREGIHCKARSIYLHASHIDHALSMVFGFRKNRTVARGDHRA